MNEAKTLDVIRRLIKVPYVEGGRSLDGHDCMGVLENFYRMRFDIELNHRGSIKNGPSGVKEAMSNFEDGEVIKEPQDFCCVVMSSSLNGKFFRHGHVGLYFDRHVLHAEQENTGTLWVSVRHPSVKHRITGYIRHKEWAKLQ